MLADGTVINCFKELEGGTIEALQEEQPEQNMNALMLTQGLKVALRDKFNESGIVDCFKIDQVVTGLLEREEGKKYTNSDPRA
ncbi:hypothetical protein Tco_0129404 [Tanacetum coccineum]